jgi:hypothetical protein
MVVKLRVKNKGLAPIYDTVARVNYTSNVSIDKDEIYLGYIGAGKTLLSSESFTVTINLESSEQEAPQTETIWQVKYKDADKNLVVEEILLK